MISLYILLLFLWMCVFHHGTYAQPTKAPIAKPTKRPTPNPTFRPTSIPTSRPTAIPTSRPTSIPTARPSSRPTTIPSARPSTSIPTSVPTSIPTTPSSFPTSQPSRQPTGQPSRQPTRQPTSQPSRQPSMQPTSNPSSQPISLPSSVPSSQPISHPTSQPSEQPSGKPSGQPVSTPSSQPSSQPSRHPTSQPVSFPTSEPSRQPNSFPSSQPSIQPTSMPSQQPISFPSSCPSNQPSSIPTNQPTMLPTSQPSRQPISRPTSQPSRQPTRQPTKQPISRPTSQPSRQPTRQPTRQPNAYPTSQPSVQPSCMPSLQPISYPTMEPSSQPSGRPTNQPSQQPTQCPSSQPSSSPTRCPTRQPSRQPSSRPSSQPTSQPSSLPTSLPTELPVASSIATRVAGCITGLWVLLFLVTVVFEYNTGRDVRKAKFMKNNSTEEINQTQQQQQQQQQRKNRKKTNAFFDRSKGRPKGIGRGAGHGDDSKGEEDVSDDDDDDANDHFRGNLTKGHPRGRHDNEFEKSTVDNTDESKVIRDGIKTLLSGILHGSLSVGPSKMLSQLDAELKEYHGYIALMTLPRIGYRRWLLYLRLVTALTIAATLITVFYDIQQPRNDHSCFSFHNEKDCLSHRSVFDPLKSLCRWNPSIQYWTGGNDNNNNNNNNNNNGYLNSSPEFCSFNDRLKFFDQISLILIVMVTVTIMGPLSYALDVLFDTVLSVPNYDQWDTMEAFIDRMKRRHRVDKILDRRVKELEARLAQHRDYLVHQLRFNLTLDDLFQFDFQWGLSLDEKNKSDAEAAGGSKRLNFTYSDRIAHDIRGAMLEAIEYKFRLDHAPDARVGLEMMYLLLRDLLGRVTPEAKIFEAKVTRNLGIFTYKMSPWFQGGVLVPIILGTNLGLLLAILSLCEEREAGWLNAVLVAMLGYILVDAVVVETAKVLWTHYYSPSLLKGALQESQDKIMETLEEMCRPQVMIANPNPSHIQSPVPSTAMAYNNSAPTMPPSPSALSQTSPHHSQMSPPPPLSVPEIVFTSYQLAQYFPRIMESHIALAIHQTLPQRNGEHWGGALVGANWAIGGVANISLIGNTGRRGSKTAVGPSPNSNHDSELNLKKRSHNLNSNFRPKKWSLISTWDGFVLWISSSLTLEGQKLAWHMTIPPFLLALIYLIYALVNSMRDIAYAVLAGIMLIAGGLVIRNYSYQKGDPRGGNWIFDDDDDDNDDNDDNVEPEKDGDVGDKQHRGEGNGRDSKGNKTDSVNFPNDVLDDVFWDDVDLEEGGQSHDLPPEFADILDDGDDDEGDVVVVVRGPRGAGKGSHGAFERNDHRGVNEKGVINSFNSTNSVNIIPEAPFQVLPQSLPQAPGVSGPRVLTAFESEMANFKEQLKARKKEKKAKKKGITIDKAISNVNNIPNSDPNVTPNRGNLLMTKTNPSISTEKAHGKNNINNSNYVDYDSDNNISRKNYNSTYPGANSLDKAGGVLDDFMDDDEDDTLMTALRLHSMENNDPLDSDLQHIIGYDNDLDDDSEPWRHHNDSMALDDSGSVDSFQEHLNRIRETARMKASADMGFVSSPAKSRNATDNLTNDAHEPTGDNGYGIGYGYGSKGINSSSLNYGGGNTNGKVREIRQADTISDRNNQRTSNSKFSSKSNSTNNNLNTSGNSSSFRHSSTLQSSAKNVALDTPVSKRDRSTYQSPYLSSNNSKKKASGKR